MSSDPPEEIAPEILAASERWNRLTEQEKLAAEIALYPELAPHGRLDAAIQAAAAELALDLGTVSSRGLNPRGWAYVDGIMPYRRMQISCGVLERVFTFSGWDRGVQCVEGSTPDLGELVRVAAAWRRGAAVDEMQETAPSVKVNSMARAHERGPAEYVAESWRWLRASQMPDWFEEHGATTMASIARGLADIAQAAYAVPVLRQLLPFTSHYWLTFSTCTGYPYDRSLPFVGSRILDGLEGDGYRVRHGCARDDDDDSDYAAFGGVVGEVDDADSAIAILVAHLPADIGAARAGTADDS